MVDVTTQTYLNTSIVLSETDRWTFETTSGGLGGPSVIFHISSACNIYSDIPATEAFIDKLTAALNEAKETLRRRKAAELHEAAGL